MQFKELPTGHIFEMLGKEGKTQTLIKSETRHAIELVTGEEVKVHPTKKIDLPRPIRGGEFAVDAEGRPMIVERLKNGTYACEYIQRIGRGTLAEGQVSVLSLKQGDSGETRNELYITLQRLEKALKNARNALETGKDILEDLE